MLPDAIGRCKLPSTLDCPAVGLPAVCASGRRSSCPPPAQSRCAAAAAAATPGAVDELCTVLAHLGHAHALPAGSLAEALLAAGHTSVSGVLTAAPAALAAAAAAVPTEVCAALAAGQGSG